MAGFLFAGLAGAADRNLTLRDWTGRGLAPEIISYGVAIDINGTTNGSFCLNVTRP